MKAQCLATVTLILCVAALTAQPPGGAGGGGAPPPMGGGPEAKPKKSALELAIEEALKNNPDLKVATAKAAEAEASLNAARAQLVRKVVAASMEIDSAKAMLAENERRLVSMERSRTSVKGSVSDDDVRAARNNVAKYKTALATAQAELDYLTGKSKVTLAITLDQKLAAYDGNTIRLWELASGEELRTVEKVAARLVKGPAGDKLRKTLQTKVSVKFNATKAVDVLETLRKQASELHIQANTKGEAWAEPLTATLTDITLAAALQLLEDTLGNHRVVVRDYGLLIAPTDKLPTGALTLSEFLKVAPEGPSPKIKEVTPTPK